DFSRLERLAGRALPFAEQLGLPPRHRRVLDLELVLLAAVEGIGRVEVVVAAQLDGELAFLDDRRIDDVRRARAARGEPERGGERRGNRDRAGGGPGLRRRRGGPVEGL